MHAARFDDARARILRDVLAHDPLPSPILARRQWMLCGARVLGIGVVCAVVAMVCTRHPGDASDVTLGLLIGGFLFGALATVGKTVEGLRRDLSLMSPAEFDEVMRLVRSDRQVAATVERWRARLGGDLRAVEGRLLCAASDRLFRVDVDEAVASRAAAD